MWLAKFSTFKIQRQMTACQRNVWGLQWYKGTKSRCPPVPPKLGQKPWAK